MVPKTLLIVWLVCLQTSIEGHKKTINLIMIESKEIKCNIPQYKPLYVAVINKVGCIH